MPTLEVDTIVIGGGLLGWSAAYPLVKSGQRVALVDRMDEGHATQAGAGIIAPGMNVRAYETGCSPIKRAAICGRGVSSRPSPPWRRPPLDNRHSRHSTCCAGVLYPGILRCCLRRRWFRA